MAWTATVQRDADKPNVGWVSATWDAGGSDEFTYRKRSAITMAAAQEFKAEAEAARDDELARRQSNANLASTLEGILNG
jgi:hypothetical protein